MRKGQKMTEESKAKIRAARLSMDRSSMPPGRGGSRHPDQTCVCSWCGKEFSSTWKNYQRLLKRGTFYCNTSCSGYARQKREALTRPPSIRSQQKHGQIGRPLKAETNYASKTRMRLWLTKLSKAKTVEEQWEVILQAEGVCVLSGSNEHLQYGLEDEGKGVEESQLNEKGRRTPALYAEY
jgi:hypothetical protein